MTTINTVLTLASQQLQDAGTVRWTNTASLVPYANLGILEIITLKPDAYPTTQDVTLVAGPTQSIPTTAINLVDVVGNVIGGKLFGAIISLNKQQMDLVLYNWTEFPPNAVVRYAMIDDRNPKIFYVFPPQPTGTATKARCVLTLPPTVITSTGATFPLDDSYQAALVDYIVYRCLVEETTVPNAVNKAQQFQNAFLRDLGMMENTEKQKSSQGK